MGRFSKSSKSTPWLNLRFIFYDFVHNEADNIDKAKISCQILIEIYQSKRKCDFPDPLGSTIEIKTRSLVEKFLFIALEKVKYNGLYLIKLLARGRLSHSLIACHIHIHHPSQLWKEKIDNG